MASNTFDINLVVFNNYYYYKRRLQSKITNFPTPCFCAPLKEFPLGSGHWRLGSKNQNDGATRSKKKFDDISSRLDTIQERDRRTDRWTTGNSKDRAYAQRRMVRRVSPSNVVKVTMAVGDKQLPYRSVVYWAVCQSGPTASSWHQCLASVLCRRCSSLSNYHAHTSLLTTY